MKKGGAYARRRGHNYEREVANRFRKLFPKSRRQLEYHAEDARGVDLQNTGRFAIQCKRNKGYAPISKLEEVKPRAGEMPMLITKGDRKRDVAVLYLDDLLEILSDIGVVYE